MNKPILLIASLLISSPLLTMATEQSLLGATQFLQRVEAATSPDDASKPTQATPLYLFGRDLAAYQAKQASLTPDAAAADWLALYERFLALPPSMNNEYGDESSEPQLNTPTLPTVLDAMPGPASWPALSRLLDQRPTETGIKAIRNGTLQILFSLISGNSTNLQKDIMAFDVASKAQTGNGHSANDPQWQVLKQQLLHATSNGTNLVDEFRQLLVDLKKINREEMTVVKAPDLVTLGGATEAEKLLLETFAMPHIHLIISEGGETKKLAQRLALQHMADLKEPQWELISSVDQTELYEAMAKKFPQKNNAEPSNISSPFVAGVNYPSYSRQDSEQNRYRQKATIYYLLGLLLQKRSEEAVNVVNANFVPANESMYNWYGFKWASVESLISRNALYDFLKQALQKKPDLPFWDEYGRLALLEGKSEEVANDLKAQLATKKLPLPKQIRLMTQLANTYFAADQIEAGFAYLSQIPELKIEGESARDQIQLRSEMITAANEIAQLGKLLERKEWVDQGIALTMKLINKANEQSESADNYFHSTLINQLISLGHYADAEAAILQSIETKVQKTKAQNSMTRQYQNYDELLSMDLMMLVSVYNRMGHHADVLYLMEKCPWWSANDLKALNENWCEGKPLSVMVAEALIAAGRRDEASRILKYTVEQNPANDKAYEPLIGISSSELLPWLDSLYHADRLEERPLIWKAALLLKTGKLDEAEITAREALRVDPTDGEEPAGDRVRGYGVLSDILKAKGNAKESEFFAKVVKSVRVAEQGDALTNAKLIKRSLSCYEEAAGLFVDAYCVQWRLGERLNALGRTEEAEKHYELAFSRMPEQFGQVANLCFGCEGVFQSTSSRGAADRILTRMEKSGSTRPQVYFLLGQLREAEERYTEAYHYYQRSVELDPSYLDGWKHLAELTDSLFIPSVERDRITLHMLRLDPLQRHSYSSSLNKILDFKGLWEVLETNHRPDLKAPAELFILKAARDRHEKDKSGNQGSHSYRYYGYQRNQQPSWGKILTSHSLIQGLLNLQQEGQRNMYNSYF